MTDVINATETIYIGLFVSISIGKMQAEIAGKKLVFERVIMPTDAKSPSVIFRMRISVVNLTMQTPMTAAETIAAKSRVRDVFHDCVGAMSAPIATAVISGKIISFSPKISAEPTINATTVSEIAIDMF